MKALKSGELREKSVEELKELLALERTALYIGRRDIVFRKNSDTASMSVRRHNIARILTIMSEPRAGEKK